MGGADARGRRPCGHRGGSQLRADVWRAAAARENGSPGCGRAGRGESPRVVSDRVSAVGGATGDAASAANAAAAGRDAERHDLLTPIVVAAGGLSLAVGGQCAGADRLATLDLPADLARTLAPLQQTLEALTARVAEIDRRIRTTVQDDAVVTRLQSVPGVGPVVAVTFRATVDRIDRFREAGQVSALAGLVPREDSSGERRQRGHITKTGSRELRSLLIQAAWACWRSRSSGALRVWAEQLAARRGRRIAVVALARRLSRLLFAIWRDGSTFEPALVAR